MGILGCRCRKRKKKLKRFTTFIRTTTSDLEVGNRGLGCKDFTAQVVCGLGIVWLGCGVKWHLVLVEVETFQILHILDVVWNDPV